VIIDNAKAYLDQGMSDKEAREQLALETNLTPGLIHKYVKIAREEVEDVRQKAKLAADEAYIRAVSRSAVNMVMSRQERLEYLTQVIRGEIKITRAYTVAGIVVETPEEPSHGDRLKALAEINKMEGDYAPTKIAQTTIEGQDIQRSLSDQQLVDILKEINNLK